VNAGPLLCHASAEWAYGGADGSGVRVCVLDTGVDASHPMVGGVQAAMRVELDETGEPQVRPTEPVDSAGHGTACAGVIRSLAPACSLASVQVLTSGTQGAGHVLLAGLKWAIDEGYDVINLSLSTSKPALRADLAELCDIAYFRRSIICASAHNSPVASYPWRFAAVTSVASIDQRTVENAKAQHYYNLTPPVEFFAPGVNVQVAWTGGSVIKATGNSFATPYITGICALILSKHPELTPFEVKTLLYSTSANVGGSHVR
jgi:subtilisin family serine protease